MSLRLEYAQETEIERGLVSLEKRRPRGMPNKTKKKKGGETPLKKVNEKKKGEEK